MAIRITVKGSEDSFLLPDNFEELKTDVKEVFNNLFSEDDKPTEQAPSATKPVALGDIFSMGEEGPQQPEPTEELAPGMLPAPVQEPAPEAPVSSSEERLPVLNADGSTAVDDAGEKLTKPIYSEQAPGTFSENDLENLFDENLPEKAPGLKSEIKDKFFTYIGEKAETWHGGFPTPTNDAAESRRPEAERTKDIAYGHKMTPDEVSTGKIYGINLKDKNGDWRELTPEEGRIILEKDMEVELELALDKWEPKLEAIGAEWGDLEEKYRLVLQSLAFNMGGGNAGKQYTKVLKAAYEKDDKNFIKEIRRQDNNKNTHGMDNRAVKELYAAGIIKSLEDTKSYLPLATTVSGVPAKPPKKANTQLASK